MVQEHIVDCRIVILSMAGAKYAKGGESLFLPPWYVEWRKVRTWKTERDEMKSEKKNKRYKRRIRGTREAAAGLVNLQALVRVTRWLPQRK